MAALCFWYLGADGEFAAEPGDEAGHGEEGGGAALELLLGAGDVVGVGDFDPECGGGYMDSWITPVNRYVM